MVPDIAGAIRKALAPRMASVITTTMMLCSVPIVFIYNLRVSLHVCMYVAMYVPSVCMQRLHPWRHFCGSSVDYELGARGQNFACSGVQRRCTHRAIQSRVPTEI